MNNIKFEEVSLEPKVKDICNTRFKVIKPILKWVGGKTQILDKLIEEFPIIINNYHEPFLGGGSVLFALLTYIKNGTIKINGDINVYDLNEPLIYVYKNIQTRHNDLYDNIQEFIQNYNNITGEIINRKPQTIEEAKSSKESYYYWLRIKYNKLNNLEKQTILGSSLFIFLNKTCFRGVFRISSNGFNVPYGHYNNPEIINKEHLTEISNLIQKVNFNACDFKTSLKNIQDEDFIYLDPPYVPEKNTSFVGYNKDGFGLDQHKNLFEICNNLNYHNKKFMMSNSDVILVRENFQENKYNINSILCKRSINSKNPEIKSKEVIITNF